MPRTVISTHFSGLVTKWTQLDLRLAMGTDINNTFLIYDFRKILCHSFPFLSRISLERITQKP